MKLIKYFTMFIILSCLACNEANTSASKNQASSTNALFAHVLADYHEEGLQLRPMDATYAGDDRYNDKFPNTLSAEYQSALKTYYDKYLNKLSEFPDDKLSESEQLSKAVLKWDCDINLEQLTFKTDFTPIDQMWSVNLVIGQFAGGTSAQPFNTVKDYENWLARLSAYTDWLISAEKKMSEGIEQGYVLPSSLIDKIIPQLEVQATTDVEKHHFYSPANNFPTNFSEENKDRLKSEFKEMLTNKLIPAYGSLSDFVKNDYKDAGRSSSGITGIPGGKEYYEHQIKKYTTTNMTADQIHQLGLSEVERISTEMEKVKNEVGYKEDLKSFFEYVRNKKELMPFTDPQQVIDNFNSIHDRMKPQLVKLFDLTPRAAFEVRRTESFREKSASAEYSQASLDGSRPGIFYTPIPDVLKYNTYSDESLFLHEAIPGHHYQISLTQESEVLPKFRKTLWYSGYGEGWALYTESLGKELGLYTDPYQYFGMLGMEMHRAVRLVVDTGIHAKGWSRERAIQYSLDHEAESEASIISEIERYMANPGQALAYKIGQLKIKELRATAEKALGEKYDVRQFHNQILETGCIPLALLENKINDWIARVK